MANGLWFKSNPNEREKPADCSVMELTLFFILAVLAGIHAGPIQEVTIGEQCSRTCTVSNQFKYEPGTTYEYKYDNEIRTAIQGASEDHAGLQLSATVTLEFLSKCEAVMRIKDVSLKEHDPVSATMKVTSSLLGKLLEENPIRVSYQDGNIEELCLSAPELPQVVNIKKGILSAFQISMSDINKDEIVTENDVSGSCQTEYNSTDKGWYRKSIKKSKNLLGCTDRHDYRSSVQGIPYTSNSKFQTLPLLKSTHNCDHEVEKSTGRLVNAMCIEKHVFVPFSRKDSGAITHNSQKLSFVKEYRTRQQSVPVNSRTTLKFDHSRGNGAEPTVKDLERKLMEICGMTKQGIQPETPSLFTSLVSTMKNMDSSSLSAIYKKIQKKTICSANNERVRKFFLDAIPLTGSTSGLGFMVELLQDNEISGVQADMWLTTLSFIQEPTMEMLATVKPLLYMKTNTEKAMLAVSSMVHSLCRNNKECENSLSVRKIIAVLDSKIGNCKVTPENFNTILYALRAIGNAGFGSSAIPTLAKCTRISSNPIEIRLSAIEAFQRIPCTADKRTVTSVLMDKEEDSEIRIAAYKALMACPTPDVISKVKSVLATEEVNQVGSYIWSHLTNLMETSDPHKQSVRTILEDEELKKEFNLDNRKFSRNYEKSLFIEKLNTGVTAEGDLIWSSKSFIPRSAMVNLTVDLFGNAVNLFEVGGRVEGLEYFLESYFGPNGYFSEKDVKSASSERALEIVKADKSSRISKRMGAVMDHLRGSMYMKVFGNELRYMNFKGLDSLLFSNNFNMFDILKKLSKESSYQFTHSAMFIDSSVMIPTCSGFPMNLTVNGTATIDLQASGKVDVLKLAQNNPVMDIHGIIRPSSALEVSSSMSIDAFVTKVGIKMVSTLHSRTSVQGKISLTEDNELNMDFDLPEKQMDIFGVKSSFFTVHRNLEREQKMITENRNSMISCSGSTLAKITGLELCGELSFPNASLVANAPYFPMTGPVKMGVSLHKRDSLTGYRLRAKSLHTKDMNIIRVDFSTPGSKVDRRINMDFNLNKIENTFESGLSSPWFSGGFKGTVVNTRPLKEVHGKLNLDGSLRYEVKASLASEKSGPGMLFTPSVSIRVPKRDPMELTGTIKYAPWKLLDTEMSLTGVTRSPISVSASLINKLKLMKASTSLILNKKQTYSADASVQKILYKKKINYKPLISIRTPSSEVFAFGGNYVHTYGKNVEIQGTLDKIVSEPVILKAKVVKKEYRRNRDLYNIKVDLRSKPMDIKLKTKLDNRNMKTIATDVDLTYVIRRIARDNIKLVSKVINLSSESLTKAKMSMNLASKRYADYNFKMLGNINHNRKHSEIDTNIFYGRDFKDSSRQIILTAAMDRVIKSWKQSALKFNGQFRKGNDIKLVGKISHAHTTTSLDNSVIFRLNGDAVSSSLKLKDASKSLKNINGELELSIPGKTISLSQTIVEDTPNHFISTMNAQMGKSKNMIITKWEKPSPRELMLSSEVKLAQMDPLHLSTGYKFSPTLYRIHAAVSNGKSNYSALSTAEFTNDRIMKIAADVESPFRRILANFEGKKDGQRLSSQTDFRWNADRDDSQRIIVSGSLLAPSINNIDGSLAVQHPSTSFGLNLKHSASSKYSSKLEVQVDNNQFFLIDTTFGSYTQKNGNELVGTINLKTPMRSLKSLTIEMNHGIEDTKYETKLDVKWNPKNVMSSTFTIKRPLLPNAFNVELIAKTPFKQMKTVHVSLVNRIRNGVFTVAKMNWNRQSVQVDITLTNKGNKGKTDLQGQVDLKTSFRDIKDGSIKLAHSMEKGIYKTDASIRLNKKQYGFENIINHRSNGWSINNDGKFTFITPEEQFLTIWDHRNTLNEITSSAEVTIGNKKVVVTYSGLRDFGINEGRFSSALETKSTVSFLKDFVFQINHEYKQGYIVSNYKFESDRNLLAFANAKYIRENGQVTSSLTMSNPVYDGDMSIKVASVYDRYPMTGNVELELTPLQITKIDLSMDKDRRDNTDLSAVFSTPALDPITLKVSRKLKSSVVDTTLSLNYALNKEIRLETEHNFGITKILKAKFMSPYTKVFTSEVKLTALETNFESSASLEAEPFIPRINVAMTGDIENGIKGNMKLATKSLHSTVSISSEMSNGQRNSMATIEYTPGKIIQVISEYKLNRLTDLKMFVEVNTPFSKMPFSALRFQSRGDLREFNNNAEIEYAKGKKLSLTTAYSTRNGYDGSLNLQTPWSKPLRSGFTHRGSLDNFESHIEMIYDSKYTTDISHRGTLSNFASEIKLSDGKDVFIGNANFENEPKLNTKLRIETPFKNWEDIRISYSLDGTSSKFNQEAEVFMPMLGTFRGDSVVDFENTISLLLNMKTPIKGFKSMSAALSHSGNFEQFQSQGNIRNGRSVYGGIVKFSRNPAINVEISLETPYTYLKQSKASIMIDGEPKNFKSNFGLQVNKDISEIDLDFAFKRKLDIDLSIRSPYMDPVKASIDHWGSMKKFNTKLRLRAGKHKVISDVRFQVNPSFNTFVSLKTPFRLLKNHQFSLKHAGNMNSFKCNMDYKLNSLNYNGDLTFQNLNLLRGELNFKGSNIKPIKAVISHDGPIHNFKTKGELSMGKKTGNLALTLNAVDGLKTSVKIQTPIQGYESMQAGYTHTGQLNNFKCHGEASLNKAVSQFDLMYDVSRDMTISMNIKTPFTGINELTTSLTYAGNMNNFNSGFTFSKNGRRAEVSAVFSNVQKILGAMSIRSNIPAIVNTEINFDHSGNLRRFVTHGDITIGQKKSEADVSFDSTQGYQGKATISTISKTIEASFGHQTTETTIESAAELTIDKLTLYDLKLDMAMDPSISASVTVKTPISGLELSEITLNHDGQYKNFRSQVGLVFLGERGNVEFVIETEPNMQGRFLMESSLFKRTELTMSHVMTIDGFQSTGECLYDRKSQILLEATFSKQGPVTGSFKLISPHLKNIKASFNHEGEPKSFKTSAEIKYAGKSTDIDVVFDITRDVEGKLSLNTPITKNFEIQMKSDGPLKNAKSSFKILYGGDSKLSLTSQWKILSDINCEVVVETPYEGFKKVSAKLGHSGNTEGFESEAKISVEDQILTGSAKFSPSNGRLVMSAPFMKEFDANYNINGHLEEHVADIKMTYGLDELLDITSTMTSSQNNIKSDISIRTIKTVPVSTSFSMIGGSWSRFSIDTFVLVNNDKHEAKLSFNKVDEVSVEIGLRSPYTVPLSSKILLKGKVPNNMEAVFEVVIDSVENRAVMSFSNLREMVGNLNIMSPYVMPVSAVVEVKPNSKRFGTKVEITIGSDKHSIDMNLNRMNGIDGSFTLSSPLTVPFSGYVAWNGKLSSFKSNLKVIADTESFIGDVSFSNEQTLKGSVSIVPPFNYERFEAAFEHSGAPTNFKSHAEVLINQNRVFSTDVTLNVETSLTGKVDFSINDNSGSASFDHSGPLSSFTNVVSVEYNSENLVETTVSFTKVPISLDITMKAPFYDTISGKFEHTGNKLNFKNHAVIVYSGETTEIDLSCNFASKLEGRLMASSPFFPTIRTGFDISNKNGLKSLLDFSIGEAKYTVDSSIITDNGVDAEISLSTPIQGYRRIATTLTHKGVFPEVASAFTLKTGRRTLASTNFVLSSVNKLSLRSSVQSIYTPTLQLNLEHTGEIDEFNSNAELRVNGKPMTAVVSFKKDSTSEGSVSLSTPYTEDMSGTFKINFNLPSAEFISTYGSRSVSGFATTTSRNNQHAVTAGLKTPMKGFEDVKGSMVYKKMFKGFEFTADLDIDQTNKFDLAATSRWGSTPSSSITLKTPFKNFRYSSADIKLEGVFPNLKAEMNIHYANEKYSLSSELQHGQSTLAEMKITTPVTGYNLVGFEFNLEGSPSDFMTNTKIMLPSNEVIDARITNIMTPAQIESRASLQTPYTEDMSFEIDYRGKPADFTNNVVFSFGSGVSLKSVTLFSLEDSRLNFDTTMTSIINGRSDEQKATLTYTIGELSEASANVQIFESIYSFDSSLQLGDNINGKLSLKTPLVNVRDVGLTFEHSSDRRRFISKATLRMAPGKTIDGSVEYVKYGWRRLQTSVEIKTPFSGFESSKMSYTHSASVDSFECDGAVSMMENDFAGNLKASRSPMSVTLQLNTPFENFEQLGTDMKMNYGSMFFSGDASVTYMKDKTISVVSKMDMSTTPKELSLRLATPFRSFQYADMSLTHSGEMSGFQSIASINAPFMKNVRAEVEGQISSFTNMVGTVTVTSQIQNFENLKLSLKNSAIRARVNSRLEVSWAPSKSIIFDGSFRDTKTAMSADVAVSTPFDSFKQYRIKSETTMRNDKYSHSFFSSLDGNTHADFDVNMDFGRVKSLSVTMKSPMAIESTFQGKRNYNKYIGSAVVTIKDEAIKLDSSFDMDTNMFTATYKCPKNDISLSSTFSTVNPRATLMMNGDRYGYNLLNEQNNAQLKAVFPSRSYLIRTFRNGKTTEGVLMWDADRDETKKFGFRSTMTSTIDSVKADVTLMMPSLGKDVQVDSEMILNRGRIIFDGKTELSYSQDSRKKFTITSRLADVSNEWSSKNYSFSLGISHPYTSVGINVDSHVARTSSKYTGGLSLEYLTVNRETKTFSVNGEVNKIRQTVDFEMISPVKSIAISGAANTDSPLVLSLKNKYDNKRPLNTRFAVEPKKRSVSFEMNYDLDNQESEFHIVAKYENSSAVSAEMFHVLNRQKITDILTTMRLNNSHLFHTRLHWRPAMMKDFMELLNRKGVAYEKKVSNFARRVSNDVDYELVQKYNLITREMIAEMNLDMLKDMYDANDFYIKDIADSIGSKMDMRVAANDVTFRMMNMVPDMGALRLSKQMAQIAADNYNNGVVYVTKSANSVYNSAILRNLTSQLPDLNQKYNDYMDYMYNIRSIPQKYMGERYIPAMKDTVALIDSRLNGEIMQQGKNAYKYWEVSENVQMIVDGIMDWVKEEIDAEISDIKATLLNLKKSTVTVYDPEHGEIQLEVRLPFPVKSLNTIPILDVTPLLTKCRGYSRYMPTISVPLMDSSALLPPFDGQATIHGDRITTFDGLSYNMNKRCTFLLARDFVDGNFSAILNNDENSRSVVVLTKGMSIEIISNGTVLVNGAPIKSSQTINGISIQTKEDRVSVNGAGSFAISYNKDFDLFSFRLNGWYYGKVGGLFGTYDNEPSNDLMTSYGKHISNSDRFASTWDVGTSKCR